MVDYGMFYAYWAQDWETTPNELIERIERANDIGFDILEINCNAVIDWGPENLARVREHAEETDIKLTFATSLTEDADISAHDPEVRERGIDRLTSSIETVEALGGEYLGGITYGPWNPSFEGGLDKKAARTERAIETWQDIAEVAENHGVTCTVEVVNRFEQFMLNTAEEAREFVEQVDSSNLQIMLDTFHMNIEEDDMPAAIETAGEQLGHFHVGENNRRPPKEGGNIPWEDIGMALREINYDGPVVMEPFMIPGGSIAQDIGIWRDLSQDIDLDATAEQSLAFLEETIEG